VAHTVTIERVREEMLFELLPLVRAYCDFYEVAPTDSQLLALSRALLADPNCEGVQLLARDDDGRAIGFATVYWSWATTSAERIGVMNDLYVEPQARGSGAAEALIEGCRRECTGHGAGKLTWQTALDNERARRVYDRVGATREQWLDYWLPAGESR
jgi:GNAT superfamily N-acetyltransferase